MKNRQKVWGWILVIFGWTGVAICAAGTLCVWILTQRIGDAVDRVVTSVTDFTTEVGQRSTQAETKVDNFEQQLKSFERQVRDAVTQAVEGRMSEAAGLGDLATRLEDFSTRLRNWSAAAESARDLVDLLGDLFASLGVDIDIGENGRQDLQAALASGLDQMGRLSTALTELANALDKPRDATQLLTPDHQILLPRINQALAKMARQTSAFTNSLGAIESSAIELRKRIKRRLTGWALLATLLLIWGAFAQYALARRGQKLATGTETGAT